MPSARSTDPAALAHDLNNLLLAIVNASEAAEASLSGPLTEQTAALARSGLQTVILAAQQAAGLARAIMDAPASAAPAAQKPAQPQPAVKPQSEKEQSGIWLDALSSVLRPVPVMNAGWIQVSRRMVSIQDGKIEGAKPDKVVYFLAPDDSMRAMRIEKGDLVLIVPQTLPVDSAIMLVEYNNHRYLRKVKRLQDFSVILQSFDREYDAVTAKLGDVNFIGRVVKLEITL